jgi:hypothetical protein
MDPTLHLRETDRILARVFGEEGDGERSDGAADG